MRHLPALDGLRGIAILLVLALHGWSFDGGGLGVDLFFVLSGFLITRLLLDEYSRTGAISFRGFYRRRAARLLPALLLLLGFYVLLAPLFGDSVSRAGISSLIGITYTTNGFMASQSHVLGSHVDHLWSLAEEEQFYLLWPPILLILLRRGRSAVVLLSLAAVASVIDLGCSAGFGNGLHRLWFSPDTHASSILFGCLAACLARRGVIVPGFVGAGALAAACAAVTMFNIDSATSIAVSVPLFGVFVAAGMLWLVQAPDAFVTRVVAARPLRFFGRISYGLYLWHEPALGLGHPLVTLPVCVLIAWESWRLVEQPILHRFSRSALGSDAAPSVSTAVPATM